MKIGAGGGAGCTTRVAAVRPLLPSRCCRAVAPLWRSRTPLSPPKASSPDCGTDLGTTLVMVTFIERHGPCLTVMSTSSMRASRTKGAQRVEIESPVTAAASPVDVTLDASMPEGEQARLGILHSQVWRDRLAGRAARDAETSNPSRSADVSTRGASALAVARRSLLIPPIRGARPMECGL